MQSFNEGERNMGITNTFYTFLHFKQAYYMKQYRATKKTKINDLQKEEKLKKTEENRLKEKLRKRIYVEKKRASVSSPKRGSGFSSVQGLSRATNRVKNVLLSSPQKK